MVLVDSSVWIANLRGEQTPEVHALRQLIDSQSEQVLVGDLILLEVLQGARSDAHAAIIEQSLRRFKIVSILNEEIALHAARLFRVLRSRGITIRKTSDLIIGTFCIENRSRLLYRDRDFDALRELGLQIVGTGCQPLPSAPAARK